MWRKCYKNHFFNRMKYIYHDIIIFQKFKASKGQATSYTASHNNPFQLIYLSKVTPIAIEESAYTCTAVLLHCTIQPPVARLVLVDSTQLRLRWLLCNAVYRGSALPKKICRIMSLWYIWLKLKSKNSMRTHICSVKQSQDCSGRYKWTCLKRFTSLMSMQNKSTTMVVFRKRSMKRHCWWLFMSI